MKILIVEDDLISQEIMKTILEPYAHCEVAENGQVAVDKFQAVLVAGDPYDLICLDIMMPVMDGQTALKEIRRLESAHGIGGYDMVKVAMVTALEDPHNVMEALAKGPCEVYITKPINRQKIEGILQDFGLLET